MRKRREGLISKIDRLMMKVRGPSTRHSYWSCSPFSDWIRKISGVQNKPPHETMEGWYNWRKSNEEKFGYWVAEELLDFIQDIVLFPSDLWNAIRYYIKNRYFDKLHYLPTQLKPGQYYDVDTRILHGLFETLVDFIEVEKAHMHWITYTPSAKELRDWFMYGTKPDFVPRPLAHRVRFIRVYSDRSAEAGLRYLRWETTLDDPEQKSDYPEWQPPEEGVITQARAAKEMIELYNWWKVTYPARPDPMDVCGWSAYCDQKTDDPLWERTEEEREQTRTMLDAMSTIEQQYADEDERMIIRLIKIRKHLWT